MHKKRKIKHTLRNLLIVVLIVIVGIFIYDTNFGTKATNNKKIKKMVKETEIDNTIFKDYQKEAAELVSNMTLGEKDRSIIFS